jgi:hypothetical protein
LASFAVKAFRLALASTKDLERVPKEKPKEIQNEALPYTLTVQQYP